MRVDNDVSEIFPDSVVPSRFRTHLRASKMLSILAANAPSLVQLSGYMRTPKTIKMQDTQMEPMAMPESEPPPPPAFDVKSLPVCRFEARPLS